uniref:Uncharacterized protein n=1 Tax=Cacopsylla melanoneura TaxID=428564 RepID=A0A8D8TRE9_9HEMI
MQYVLSVQKLASIKILYTLSAYLELHCKCCKSGPLKYKSSQVYLSCRTKIGLVGNFRYHYLHLKADIFWEGSWNLAIFSTVLLGGHLLHLETGLEYFEILHGKITSLNIQNETSHNHHL